MRLAILSTHPIQYHGHWFRTLAACSALDLEVFYCYYAQPRDQARAGFGVDFDWDIPVLEGYRYRFLTNISRHKRPQSFSGLDTPELADIIARERYDAVLINGWHYKAAWQAMLACWRSGIPVMVRGDSQLRTPRGPLRRWMKYPVYRSFIPKLHACLAVGTRSREYYLHYGAQPERIFLVPHAIDSELFGRIACQLELRRHELRQRWNFDESQAVFLFVGKFVGVKRPMDFVQAIENAVARSSKVVAIMVGDGPLREICERHAAARKLPIRFAGFLNQSQIVEAYVACDALVLPSDDTWGIVVNEAMSCGRAAVVSDAAGCGPDLIQPGRTGEIFPLGDIKRLADVLVALAARNGQLRSMGACARAALVPYSTQAAVRGVSMALASVTGKN